jgi:hypothetical protein
MRLPLFVQLCFALALCFALVVPAHAQNASYRTATTRWRAADGDFAAWQRSGVTLTSARLRIDNGRLALDPRSATSGTDPYGRGGYFGRNFYNGGSFVVGEATGPIVASTFAFKEAVASWNAATPAGSWVETQLRVRVGERWTTWYNMGVWAADGSTVERHSVADQDDGDARVAVDTLVVKGTATAYQARVRLFSANTSAIPNVFGLAVTVSTTPARPSTLAAGNSALWNRSLPVPECSQMVYPDGGEVWCSPTSLSMVLGYWSKRAGPCEPRVRASVAGVYDWSYNGHGNWPFNVAYASTRGMEGFVTRFASMREAEPWIAAGVPVIISFGWQPGTLTGAPASSSSGHISVLAGFDDKGNPIIHDTAAANNGIVRRTYLRTEFERLWLEHSGGTAYLVYPRGYPVPR